MTRLLLVVSLLLIACASEEVEVKEEKSTKARETKRTTRGRYIFPELDHQGLCQSPINIRTKSSRKGHKHEVHLMYHASRQRIVNKGHTIEVDYDPGSSIEVDGRVFEFRQFHFHTPSEHLIDGVTYPMEMHLVHTLKGDDQTYLVIAVLFKEGDTNAFIAGFLDAVPLIEGEAVRKDTIDIRDLYDGTREYFSYQGSLTTPPYTESVSWVILKNIRKASPEQIKTLNELEGNNARHIQPLSGRTVEGD